MKYLEPVLSFLLALAKMFFRSKERPKTPECPCSPDEQDETNRSPHSDPDTEK